MFQNISLLLILHIGCFHSLKEWFCFQERVNPSRLIGYQAWSYTCPQFSVHIQKTKFHLFRNFLGKLSQYDFIKKFCVFTKKAIISGDRSTIDICQTRSTANWNLLDRMFRKKFNFGTVKTRTKQRGVIYFDKYTCCSDDNDLISNNS